MWSALVHISFGYLLPAAMITIRLHNQWCTLFVYFQSILFGVSYYWYPGFLYLILLGNFQKKHICLKSTEAKCI